MDTNLSTRTMHRICQNQVSVRGTRRLRKEIKNWLNSEKVPRMHFGCLSRLFNSDLQTDLRSAQALLERFGRARLSSAAYEYMEEQIREIEGKQKTRK